MVTDFLVGVAVGIIGLKLVQNKIAHDRANSFGGFFHLPPMSGGMTMQPMGGIKSSDDKEEPATIYELGKTNMEKYCKVHKDVPYCMDRFVEGILTDLECKGTENEIRYKLEILKKDIDIAVKCVSKQDDEFVLKVYEQLQEWIDLEIYTINKSLKSYKMLYIPNHTCVKDVFMRMDAMDKDFIADLIELGNHVLDGALYNDSKEFKELVLGVLKDNNDKKLKEYLTNIFEPRYNEIVLKNCA